MVLSKQYCIHYLYKGRLLKVSHSNFIDFIYIFCFGLTLTLYYLHLAHFIEEVQIVEPYDEIVKVSA